MFIIFEGDIMVSDTITIGQFSGIVSDISTRTTRLMNDFTKEITVINNSQIRGFVKKARSTSHVHCRHQAQS